VSLDEGSEEVVVSDGPDPERRVDVRRRGVLRAVEVDSGAEDCPPAADLRVDGLRVLGLRVVDRAFLLAVVAARLAVPAARRVAVFARRVVEEARLAPCDEAPRATC